MNQNQPSYSKFTLALVKENLGISVQTEIPLFPEIAPVEISDYLRKTIQQFAPLALAINPEKSRSEWLIAPILAEARERLQHRISLFSGFEFNVDAQQGLVGVCDYIICQSPEQYYITAPVVMIIEAKAVDITQMQAA